MQVHTTLAHSPIISHKPCAMHLCLTQAHLLHETHFFFKFRLLVSAIDSSVAGPFQSLIFADSICALATAAPLVYITNPCKFASWRLVVTLLAFQVTCLLGRAISCAGGCRIKPSIALSVDGVLLEAGESIKG